MFVFIKGREIQIDEEDLWLLEKHSWWWGQMGYLLSKIGVGEGRRKTMALHRVIMDDPPPPFVIDHINRDKNDNRRCNLRICTQAENNKNKDRYDKPDKGVSLRRGKWQVVIKVNGKAKWFGHYDTKEEALFVALDKFKTNAA